MNNIRQKTIIKIYKLIYLIGITLLIYKNIINNKNIKNIKVCLCTIGKKENLYIRQYVEHYKKYGVDKIFIYDNNDKNDEIFEEILNDDSRYIFFIKFNRLLIIKIKI